MMHVVPDFYSLRCWWRRHWPPAYRRELVALVAAKIAGPYTGDAVNIFLYRAFSLGISTDFYTIGEARVCERMFWSLGNRVAVLPDRTVYVYTV